MANTIINTKVLGEIIGANLPSMTKFAGVATVDDTLKSVAGDTISVEKYTYIGEAVDVAEGTAIPLSDLSMSSQNVVVKKAGKGVKLTDEEVQRRGQEVVEEAKNQLTMSIIDKIDTDVYEACKGATLKYDGKADILSYSAIVNANVLFGEEDDDEVKVMFISPLQKAQIMLDANFIRAGELGDRVVSSGVIGELAGCQIVVSNKIKTFKESTKDVFANPIVKIGGVAIKLAKSVGIEEDRSAKTKSSEFYADEHFVAYLRDASKVVLATVLKVKE